MDNARERKKDGQLATSDDEEASVRKDSAYAVEVAALLLRLLERTELMLLLLLMVRIPVMTSCFQPSVGLRSVDLTAWGGGGGFNTQITSPTFTLR